MTQSSSKWIIPLILFLSFSSCKTNIFLSKVDTQRITVDKDAQAEVDAKIASMINPYKSQLDVKMDRQIGTLTTTLEKSKPEGTLNNWMTDIIHERAEHYHGKQVDFAVQNYGGIRVNSIPTGPIAVRKIYELMPFDNKIVILELKGELMTQMIDYIAKSGGMPVSSSVRLKIDSNKKATEVTINGKAIDMNHTYKMALPDYVANGGGGTDFLTPLPQIETGWNVREAIIDYMDTYKEPMSAKIENRITKL